jgi:ribosomal protein L12E/L44/L45/RPP1/RPP2
VKDLLSNVGSGGGAPAASSGAAPAATAEAAAEAPKEEEKEADEESDGDMVRRSFFCFRYARPLISIPNVQGFGLFD